MMALLTAKNIAILLALATTAFCVSTIVLAVQKSNLEDELQDAIDKLDTISTLTTPTTIATSPITSSSATESPPNPTTESTTTITPIVTDSSTVSTASPTQSTPSTEFPWPTMTVPSEPTFPTLPTGLPNPEEIIYRLPLDIRPIKYKLYIHPDLKGKTCEGTVSIQIEVDKETNLIVMHAKNLEIGSISILNMMARMRIRVRRSYLDSEREMFFIELDELLYTSTPYTVSISYNCQLDGLVGLYASTYLGANDESRGSHVFANKSIVLP